jgi:hypothetical protein
LGVAELWQTSFVHRFALDIRVLAQQTQPVDAVLMSSLLYYSF